ncbi:PEP-CTERM sorting domain-containing protein [Alteromonas sp. ASW11-130]|uniref:PEP-CTERM sorting domain-containing protein n=1 Tax=Alteromonas sp. ASW11-130 TaxID=3015775 RepID=UPI002241A656|nr:PEP-CTERM sorting domain-containing protein [Alteromonas sp. ASW11-130]MCW8093403.1 PEP-CTERM sorting domain-containing protein [Alteromonas sp. ASW11-130]
MKFIKFFLTPLLFLLTQPAFASLITWDSATGGNDHWYQVVLADGINRTEANRIAENRGGYLVTITSQEEQDFITATMLSPYVRDEIRNSMFWTGGYATNTNLSELKDGASPEWAWQNGEAWTFDNGLGSSADANGMDHILTGGVEACGYDAFLYCESFNIELASFMRISAFENWDGQATGNWSDLRESGTLPEMMVDALTGEITSPFTLVNRIGGYIIEYNSKPLSVSEPTSILLLALSLLAVSVRRRTL